MRYPLDKNGNVINEASFDKIDPKYLPLIEKSVSSFRNKFDEKNISIFLRGSVSVGRAQPNVSDLDMVVVSNEPFSAEELKWRTVLSNKLEKQYPFVTMVDITCVTLSELLDADGYQELRVCLSTQSVCLYGQNILDTLEKVKPNKDLAIKLYKGLAKDLSILTRYFSELSAEKSYLGVNRPPKFWCVWTMRTLLRSGLGLVMCRRPVYSRDLKTCFREFVQEFPKHNDEMRQALLWAHNPINDKKPVADYLKKFVPEYICLWEDEGIVVE